MLLFGEHRLPRILKSFPFFIVPTNMTYVFCQKSAVLLKNSMYTMRRKKLSNLNEYEIDAAQWLKYKKAHTFDLPNHNIQFFFSESIAR